MAIAWRLAAASRHPGRRLAILATDVDEHVLARAQAAEYARAALRELPAAWIERAFEQRGDVFRLRDDFRAGVELRRADVRSELPDGPFRLIFCRNSVCTYFEEELQRRILGAVISRLAQGGFLVIGRLERLPSGMGLVPWDAALGIYRRPAA
jgi:chemotaxis protein methyltransferase CheR